MHPPQKTRVTDIHFESTYSTDMDRLHELALTDDICIRLAIAQNSNISHETFLHLATTKKHPNLMWNSLAGNYGLSAEQIRWIYNQVTLPGVIRSIRGSMYRFSKEQTREILEKIAVHSQTPAKIIAKLSKHPDPQVRIASSTNHKLNINSKKAILSDSIVTNGYNNNHILMTTLKHPELHRSLRNVAILRTLKLKVEESKNSGVINEEDVRLIGSIAMLPELELEVVKTLASHTDKIILARLYKNKMLTVKASEWLAETDDLARLEYLASNSAVPADLLARLVDKCIPELRKLIYRGTHDEIAIELAKNKSTPLESLKKLAALDDPEINARVKDAAKGTNDDSRLTTRLVETIHINVRCNPVYREAELT